MQKTFEIKIALRSWWNWDDCKSYEKHKIFKKHKMIIWNTMITKTKSLKKQNVYTSDYRCIS